MVDRNHARLAFVVLISLGLVILSHWLQDTTGLSLGDEGYLWYGSLRTAEGQVPMRDFRSYDPGRYYWWAALSPVFGDGLIGMRRSSGAFQLLGLIAGLLALTRVLKNWILLTLAGVCLILWMYPVYKLFEPAIAMMAIWVGARLLERPSGTRFLVSGIFVGLVAFIGRNFGVYCLFAFACLILYLRFRLKEIPFWKPSGVFALGVLAGYSPMLAMIAFVPGFASSFAESVAFIFNHYVLGTASLSLPVPWPWRADLSGSPPEVVLGLLKGITFLLLPVFLGLSLVLLVVVPRERIQQGHLLVACAFVGLFYAHHPYSRADLSHLAGAMPPVLMGFMAAVPLLPGRRWGRALLVAVLIAVTLPSALNANSRIHRFRSEPRRYVLTEIQGDSIWISRQHAVLLESVRRVVDQWVKDDQTIFIAPHDTMLYTALGLKAPVWDCYILWPHSEKKQLEMIRQLEESNAQWALLSFFAVDSREDLSFRKSQPLLWRHVTRSFAPMEGTGLPPDRVFLRREARLGSRTATETPR